MKFLFYLRNVKTLEKNKRILYNFTKDLGEGKMENKTNKKNVKKIIIIVLLSILVVSMVIIFSFYVGNRDFRYWIDKNVLGKELRDGDLKYIDLEEKETQAIISYGKNVGILSNNTFTIYNSSAKKVSEIEVLVSNPIFERDGKYLILGDKNKGNIYLINETTVEWEKNVEGEISQITVNKQGDVGVIIVGTTYKSVIAMYESNGEESFKTYLSTTNATDVAISKDGKYLSFAEIDTSGAALVSNIKTIITEKAKNSEQDAIKDRYTLENGEMCINIKYSNNNLVCLADKSVYSLKDGKINKIFDIDNSISFADIELDNHVCNFKENSDNSTYELNIYSINSVKPSVYFVNGTCKSIYCKENVVAVNIGSEVHFVNMNGWLIKKYTPQQNIKEILMGDRIIAIVYKDRIDLLEV